MQLPTYLSRFADMIGTMHRTTGGLSLGIKDTLPDGMISLDGSISGDISLNADKTLHYNYSAGVDFKEGFDTPGGGFLTLRPDSPERI